MQLRFNSVTAALPGVKPSDISVDVDTHTRQMTIRGSYAQRDEKIEGDYVHRESRAGASSVSNAF
jgi:HSP20 family molecular chaperone IbpA